MENILWRLENGELDGVNPKVIVLLAGTNNVGNSVPPEGIDSAAANVTQGLEAVLRVMRAKAPGAMIILMGIFPAQRQHGGDAGDRSDQCESGEYGGR